MTPPLPVYDASELVAIVAVTTLVSTWISNAFSGGFRLSKRLTTMEITLSALQADFSKLGKVLEKMSDLNGDFKAFNVRLTAGDQRMTALEQDVRELRHGEGLVLPLRSAYEVK